MEFHCDTMCVSKDLDRDLCEDGAHNIGVLETNRTERLCDIFQNFVLRELSWLLAKNR